MRGGVLVGGIFGSVWLRDLHDLGDGVLGLIFGKQIGRAHV